MKVAAIFCAFLCAGTIFECLCDGTEEEEVSVSALRYLYDLWFGDGDEGTRVKRSTYGSGHHEDRHPVTTRKPHKTFSNLYTCPRIWRPWYRQPNLHIASLVANNYWEYSGENVCVDFGYHNKTSTHTSVRHTTRKPIATKKPYTGHNKTSHVSHKVTTKKPFIITTKKSYIGHNKTSHVSHKVTTKKPLIITTKKSRIVQGTHNRTSGGRNSTSVTRKPIVIATTKRQHVSNNHTNKSPYYPSAPPMETFGNQMQQPPLTNHRQPSAPPMEPDLNHQRFDHMRQPSAPPLGSHMRQPSAPPMEPGINHPWVPPPGQQVHHPWAPPPGQQPSDFRQPPMPGNYGWNVDDNSKNFGWQIPTTTTYRPVMTTKRQGLLIVGGKVTPPRPMTTHKPITTTKRQGFLIVGGKVTTARPTTTTSKWWKRTTTKRRLTKPPLIVKKNVTKDTYYPKLFPNNSYNPQNYNPSWFSNYPANYHPNQPIGYHPSSNVYYGPVTVINGRPAPSYSYQPSPDTSILGDILRHRTERMFTYSNMPHYTHHTYVIHHYHKEKMMRNEAVRDLSLNATVLVPCASNVSLLCIDGTQPICLKNGTIMCAVAYSSTVRCGHNSNHACLPSTIDCTKTTNPGCDGFTVDAKINVPCLYNISFVGNTTLLNNVTCTLFNQTTTDRITISGTLGNMTNVVSEGTYMTNDNSGKISGTLGNMTNVVVGNTNMTNHGNWTNFCVIVSAEPSKLRTDKLDEVKPLKTPVMENIMWNIMGRFAEHIWGD